VSHFGYATATLKFTDQKFYCQTIYKVI